MATYTKPKPDADVHGFLARARQKWHPDLELAEVTIGVLAAWPSEGGDAPLKLHGYPCAATVKITPYKSRVQGIEDAVITIDGPAWKEFTDAEKLALIDHELVHLEVARDDEGQIRSDDHGRPKLKMRLHDWQLGGFRVVAERHGAAALESQMFRDAHRTYYQAVFAWSDDQAPQDEAPGLDLAAGKAPGVPQDATGDAPSWRDVTVGDLGLSEATVEILDRQTITTVGELVALARMGAAWMGQAAVEDVDAALTRFRNRRSNAEIAEYDLERWGDEAAAEPGPKRRRKVTA